jgi:hypothetical protein
VACDRFDGVESTLRIPRRGNRWELPGRRIPVANIKVNHAMANTVDLRLPIIATLLAFCVIQSAVAQSPAEDRLGGRPLEYWLEQLDSDHFSRRQAATHQLNRFGQEAVQPLVKIAKSGKLESTQRALSVLQQLAMGQSPDDDGGAWAALTKLVDHGSGSASIGARAALEEIRRDRQSQALTRLAAAGIQIDYRDFVIDSRSMHAKVLLIDKAWKGDTQILRWLRWVKDVENAVIEGDAVRHEVIAQVVRMPALRSIVMREATLRDDVIGPLSTLSRIDQLEFRYIPLTIEDAEQIAKLPLRVSLSLMGTGLPVEGAKMLRTAVPGIKLAYKQGGFLGVICNQFSARCQVDNVKPGSAAAMAGIEAGDVVIQIGDAKINSFDDLQLQVGSHYAGDEIDITYDRFGEIIKTKARLGRLDNE